MKKKVISIALVIALIAVIAAGSFAYFTDKDSATNTFTVGNVKIDLLEKQRDGNGDLEDFKDGKKLYPLVDNNRGPDDELGLPTAKNYVDKIITVKNLAADAYVRVYIAVPAALDDEDAANNILHFNQPGKNTFVGLDRKSADKAFTWCNSVKVGQFTNDDGITYNVYYSTYADKLTKDEIAGSAAYIGFYLDKGVDYVQPADGSDGYYTFNGEKINFDLTNVEIPVFAVGVQADGFTTADEAINAAFGADYNPWTNK